MTAALALLYAIVTATFLNLFWQFPLTPVLARSLSTDMGLVALAVSAYSLANMVGNLGAGLIVDRFPKAPVLAAGLALGGLALVGAGMATSVHALAAALALNGLALSVVTPAAFTLLSGLLPPESSARGMASSGAAIGVAALVGAPVAGVLGDRLGEGGAFAAGGGFLLLMAALALIGLRRAKGERTDADVGLADIVALLGDRRLHPGYAGAFVLMVANGSLVFALPPHLKALGHPGAVIGAMFSLFALSAIAVFLTPLGRWAYRSASGASMALGAGIIALALAALGVAGGLAAIGPAMLLYGFGFGLVYPAALAVVVAHAPVDRRGTAFGLFYALFSLGAATGPLLLARAGQAGLSPFLVAAVVPALFGLLMLLRARM